MKPFLDQIARLYAANESENLIDYCFVFPNKRSGMFFSKYLESYSNGMSMLPRITTINEFVMDLAGGVEATRMEQLFLLYDVYRETLQTRGRSDDLVDFDRFQYWGDIILNDFNDVDRYIVEPDQLFRNVMELRDISSNYLTHEQIEVLKEYWGEVPTTQDVEDFWRHIKHGDKESTTESFIRLWHVLLDTYQLFNTRLSQLGLTYSGRAYREVAKRVQDMYPEDFASRRYIFIGFNALSASEIKIFESLQRIGIADFYWDVASPAFENTSNKAMRFLRRYIHNFKSRYELPEPKIHEFAEIHVESIPSNIGQTKQAGAILQQLQSKGLIGDSEQATRTAVVLPDEQLFIPLLHSIPNTITDVNITMGFPLRHTPMAALITNIVTMQTKSQKLHGEITYYYQHVFSVLSHPVVRSICPDESDEIVKYINDNRIYNLSSVMAVEKWPTLTPIFTAVKDAQNHEEVFDYIERLTQWIANHAEKAGADSVEAGFIKRYLEGIVELKRLAKAYSINMSENTLFHLLERVMANQSVNFVGQPLSGMQVMGVLETRALDFDNIIMLSMNERVFPRKHYAPTFIPNTLRRAYGMATIEFQESIYSYYFYRLIARAKRVYLLYDSRSAGVKSGEMSRYIYQLKHLYPIKDLTFTTRSFHASSIEPRIVSVEKTPDIMHKLSRYLISGPDSKRLSPSAIDHYINCPLQFYLEHIEGYYVADELKEYMDEGTYGSVLHRVAENMYKHLRDKAGQKELAINKDLLKEMKADKLMIERFVTEAVNHIYLKLEPGRYDIPLRGENKLIGNFMVKYMQLMFERELELDPYKFIEGEDEIILPFKVDNDLTVNLKCVIDRTDRLADGTIRLVDYKTGADNIECSSWDNVFDTHSRTHQKCFLQLMMYCNAYAQAYDYDGPIQPIVYRFRKMATEPISPLVFKKQPITDYHQINLEYMELLSKKLHELFDPEVPFYTPDDKSSCKYCNFKKICDRED